MNARLGTGVFAAFVFAVSVMAGCALEPDYQRPAAPVQPGWTDGTSSAAAGTAADIGWREFFPDPNLKRLIELALQSNRDLRVAALNVQAAQAQYRIQRADLLPTIAATGTEEVQRSPGSVISSSASAAAASGGTATTSSGVITRVFNAGVGFTSYEIDLFGRIRSLDHAALEQYLGYEETRRGMQLSLIAEVASSYLTILADQANLKVTRDQFEGQSASYELIRRSLEAGATTALAARQQEIAVDTAKANLSAYTRQLAQDRNALALLIGGPLPDDLDLSAPLEAVQLQADLPAGLPSEVLARRPDVLAAEHQLIAANADIGAARAAFFPSISLTGSYGTASTELSGLFKDGSTAWTFSPQISLPIFAGGANQANLDLSKIQKNVNIAQYEKALQSAFKEVDDALAARKTLDEQLSAQRELQAAAADAYHLADVRFRGGVDSFLPVLTAQQALYSAQQGVVSLELSRLQNMATLYKALGGGSLEHSASLVPQ
ncbi:MAG: multidrug transporter [Hydrocarboniphaga sp.]|uniref:efflux transporter outer membrane subunit n=1 Tax=Hydrocarboniphaga sp. TaxID=2033016 RepID=UPI00260BABC1|nr:efflux transporter outer membrane subunit [Hydrocarboniphaga sp.]MDB5969079.1 multidrug transporter [Hydrocarboniphaga sp.]